MKYLATIVEKATYKVEVEANDEYEAGEIALDVDIDGHRPTRSETVVDAITRTDLEHRPYEVTAGRYDGNDENCKYSDAFATLDEALEAFDKCQGYPWQRLSYKGRVLMGVEP